MGATKPIVSVLYFSLGLLVMLHTECWHKPVQQAAGGSIFLSPTKGKFYHKEDQGSISSPVHPWKALFGLARCFFRKLNSIIMKFGLDRLKGRVAKIKCFCCLVLGKGLFYLRMALNSTLILLLRWQMYIILVVELSLEILSKNGNSQTILA